MNGRGVRIDIVDYDSNWPQQFVQLATHVRSILGPLLLSVEHVGSTAVPGLAAKPVIDITIVVPNSREEYAYGPKLRDAGFTLTVREPNWFEHRMFEYQAPRANLHMFSSGCPEVERMRLFRDWLRHSSKDRALYLEIKSRLAAQNWVRVQDYADAKQDVIAQIMTRARAWVRRGKRRKRMSTTIYGIKNCDTMKKARGWLDKQGVDYVFHDYKVDGIERDKLERWAGKVGWEVLLNRAGTTFRKLPDKDKDGLTEKKAIALMLKQPSMIKRPVIELGAGKLLVGFAPESYKAAFT